MAPTMRVTIDEGRHHYEVPASDERWNGWVVPGFILDQVRQLAQDIDARNVELDIPAEETDTILMGPDGVVRVYSGAWDETTIVEPADDGLYYVGAYLWMWEIAP